MDMNRLRDRWARLVEAVLRREQLRQIALSHSRSPSTSSMDSDYSLTFSSLDSMSTGSSGPSPFHKMISAEKQSGAKMVQSNKRNKWKGLGIFNAFTRKKKDYGKEEKELKCDHAQRTRHGLKPPEYHDLNQIAEEAKRRAEIARMREMHTLKGHLESVLKTKGIDIEKIHNHHSI